MLGAAAALLIVRSRRPLLLAAAAIGLVGATTAGVTSGRVRMVEQRWNDVREQLISGASRQLAATLESTVRLARTLADRGAAAAAVPQPDAFTTLEDWVDRAGPEAGVVVLEADGKPWSWAGRHRLAPGSSARELYARITPFYVVIESRRQTGDRVAIGHVLLAADSAVPDRDRSVASLFAAATGAALEFYPPGRAPLRTDVFDYCLPSCSPGPGNFVPDTLFSIRTAPPTQGALKLQLLESGGRTVAIAVVLCLLGLTLGGQAAGRYLALGLGTALFLFTPLGARLGLSGFFSPATYYVGALDPAAASAGDLWLSGAIALIAAIALRNRKPPRVVGLVAGAGAVLAAPFLARLLARGIAPPAGGVGADLWIAWELPIAVTQVAWILLSGVLLPEPPPARKWIAWTAAACGVAVALAGLFVWRADGGWPAWYTWAWIPAFALAALSGGRIRRLVAAAVVAGSAAAILTWGATVDGRLRLARADAERLGGARDPLAIAMLERLGSEPMTGPQPRTAADLYALWQRSSLSGAGYPAVLALWSPGGDLLADLPLAQLDLPPRLVQAFASTAVERGRPVLEVVTPIPGAHAILARPFPDGSAMTIGVGPKTRLIPPFRIVRYMRPEPQTPAPYEMSLSAVVEPPSAAGLAWQRDGQTVHGDQVLEFSTTQRHLHVTVELGELPGLLVRGALLLVFDVCVTLILWLVAEALLGRTQFVARLRGALRFRSYRFRITMALAVFFIVPTVGFSAWMAGRLRSDSLRSQDLVIRQSLRDASGSVIDDEGIARAEPLSAVADRIGAELLLYREGALGFVSAPVLAELGLLDAYLPPQVYRGLLPYDGGETISTLRLAGRNARVGFRALGSASGVVLGMPRLPDERRPMSAGDLAYALLLVTVIGLGAAAGLARIAARSLAEPVGVLRSAAEAIGRGEAPAPFGPDVPEEFVPVTEAFTRMARDVRASQAALETARQRTVAVLRNVATGVVALTADLHVTLANPRAEELLAHRLESGGSAVAGSPPEWGPVWQWLRDFLTGGTDLAGEEFTVSGRRIRVRASTLSTEVGGCVVALDDVTELAHAVRVLAWGEIARQVAHEIKNPLTPMRLGIQHLLRMKVESRGDFEQALDRTSRQILAEIDRLDAVARAFSRFGAPPAEREIGPLAAVDLVAVARETAALYALGGDRGVELTTNGVVRGLARPDELREVLVNLVENARNADARRIELAVGTDAATGARITVSDDGRGIRPEDLPRIFEPHFSTTTSGTGLGLAICKRLVESWGGTIDASSTSGRGTVVTIRLAVAG